MATGSEVPDHYFDGYTFSPARDGSRLIVQLRRVEEAMSDGEWRSLDEIAALTGDPPASVSARLRDLRKQRFGSHTVNRRYDGNGLFRYQVTT